MTGPEHYREAEEWLSVIGDETQRDPDEWTEALHSGEITAALQAAQAHATLALAAATAIVDYRDALDADFLAWKKIAGVTP